MQQQEKSFNERVAQWAEKNGFMIHMVKDNAVILKRLSDGYPIEVDARLLGNIMTDEGF